MSDARTTQRPTGAPTGAPVGRGPMGPFGPGRGPGRGGPMGGGHMMGGAPVEKAKNFKTSLKRLLTYLKPRMVPLIVVFAMAP